MAKSRRGRHRTDPPPLSAREIRFCQFYADTGNATRSYIDAGLKHSDPDVARTMAFRLLRNVHVRTYVRRLQADAAEAAGVSVEYLARGFRRAVDADVTRLFGPDGEMLPPSQWPADIRLCVSRIEVEELTESRPDPKNPRRKKKVRVGTKWKVWLENKTECRKVLAQWKRMLAPDKPPAEGDGDRGLNLEAVARAAAVLAAAGHGTVPLGPAVGAEPGAAVAGVPE